MRFGRSGRTVAREPRSTASASALLVAAGLLQAGVPIGTCILLSLLGALASFYLLRTHFSTLKPVV